MPACAKYCMYIRSTEYRILHVVCKKEQKQPGTRCQKERIPVFLRTLSAPCEGNPGLCASHGSEAFGSGPHGVGCVYHIQSLECPRRQINTPTEERASSGFIYHPYSDLKEACSITPTKRSTFWPYTTRIPKQQYILMPPVVVFSRSSTGRKYFP